MSQSSSLREFILLDKLLWISVADHAKSLINFSLINLNEVVSKIEDIASKETEGAEFFTYLLRLHKLNNKK